MNKKKIVILGTCHPFRGGLAAYNERLALEFQAKGYEVTVFTFSLQYPGFLFPGKTQYADCDAPVGLDIRVEVNSVNPFNWIKIGRKIKSQNPDLVIFCYWMAFMAPCFGTIARFCKSPKSKFIGLIHNMIPHEPTILDKLLPKYFVKMMDGFVAMADSVVMDINHFDKRNTPKVVSPHPIYDHFGEILTKKQASEKLGLNAESHYVLFFGFIRKYKGLDLLLDAFADERFREMNVKLIIAGEFYEDEEKYQNIIQKHPLKDHIILKNDFIPDEEVKDYFSVADLIAQPYRTATQSGVSQIAYHFEKPMLVTDVGGLKETIPNGKVGYVTNVDVNEIREALIDFYINDKAASFKSHILEEKQKYTWDKMIRTIEKLSKESTP